MNVVNKENISVRHLAASSFLDREEGSWKDRHKCMARVVRRLPRVARL